MGTTVSTLATTGLKKKHHLRAHGTSQASWALGLFHIMLWITMLVSPIAVTASANPTSEDFVGQIMTVQETLARLNRQIERENILAGQKPINEQAAYKRMVTKLEEIKFVHQRLLNTLKKNIALSSEEAEIKKSIDSGRAYTLEEQKPYSISYYDKLLDVVSTVQQKTENLRSSIQSADLKLEEYKQNLAETQRTWRRVKEETASDASGSGAGNLQFKQAKLELTAAQAALDLQAAQLAGLNSAMRNNDLRLQAAQHKLALIKKDLSFDPQAIDKETTRLEKQRAGLSKRLQTLLDQQKKVAGQWRNDRDHSSTQAAENAMRAQEAWQTAYETALAQTEDMVHLINTQEKLWTYRYALATSSPETTATSQWEKEATETRKHTRQAVGSYQTRQLELQSQIAKIQKKRESVDAIQQKYLTYHLDALNRTGEFGAEYFTTLLATTQVASRLIEEIANGKQTGIMDKILSSGLKFNEIWNYELWVIDEHGVTVKKVITALIILIIGIIFVKRIIRALARRLNRSKIEAGAVAGAEKILLYAGFILVVLLALRIVNIPLTAFTFLGGAIAIGFGFGAQNLINNFISGFIIMAERPIRIGDLIELDGRCVRVEEIGARCTKVKTIENIHILVPNSSFLENDITNWTLSDKMVRMRLAVGVAYGSPVEDVTQVLMQAADNTEYILKKPQPFVIFNDFGDSSLVFHVHYWLKIGGLMHRDQIASALRYQIYALFNAHDIVIAFPQQDVHLNTEKPLQIKLAEPMRKVKRLESQMKVKRKIPPTSVTAK